MPRVLVAPVRALVQRLGPHVEDVEPVVVRPGDQLDHDRAGRAPGRRSGTAASTRSSTAARSPSGARSSTSSPRPPTFRSASTSGATRSTGSPSSRWPTSARPTTSTSVEIFGCRELLPTDDVRARAEAARRATSRGAATTGSGSPRASPSTAWSRGCRGWRRASTCCSTSSAPTRRCCWSSRAACATAPPTCSTKRPRWPARWRRPGAPTAATRVSRACTCRSTGCSRTPRAPVWTVRQRRRVARHAGHRRARVGPGGGRRHPLVKQLAELRADGYRLVVCADGEGSAARITQRPARRGLRHRPPVEVQPLERGFVLPSIKLAVLGRGRRHRPPACAPPAARPPRHHRGVLRGPQARRLRRAPPARRRPLRGHGHPVDRGRRARLPAARVPRRRQALRPVRPDRRHPALHRRRDAHPEPARRRRLAEGEGAGEGRGARDRAGTGRALPARVTPPGPRVPAGHAVAARARGGVPVRRDAGPAQGHRRGQAGHGGAGPDGPARVRRRRLRQDRGRDPRRVQGGAGRQAGGGPRARPRCSRSSTPRPSRIASPATRCASRCCRASSRRHRPRR